MVLINNSPGFASYGVSGPAFGHGSGSIDSQQFVHELRRATKGGLAKCREGRGQGQQASFRRQRQNGQCARDDQPQLPSDRRAVAFIDQQGGGMLFLRERDGSRFARPQAGKLGSFLGRTHLQPGGRVLRQALTSGGALVFCISARTSGGVNTRPNNDGNT